MLNLDEAQIAAILAGLRLLQRQGCPDDLEDIATNGGKYDLPGEDFLDELCETINTSPDAVTVLIEIAGGDIIDATADMPVLLVTVDYDVEGITEPLVLVPPADGGTPRPGYRREDYTGGRAERVAEVRQLDTWLMVEDEEWQAVCKGKPVFNGCTDHYLKEAHGAENIAHVMGQGWFRRANP